MACFGGASGACAAPGHVGLSECHGGVVVCAGPDLLRPNQLEESCNGLDDDCDGVVDEAAVDVGGPCGQSAVAPCSLGVYHCVGGSRICEGAREPLPETCNGVDDDCDGVADSSSGNPPPEAVGPCSVPPPAPAGSTSPCQAGALACQGGHVVCQGAVGPTSSVDGCGIDANCDGLLTQQPNLGSDVNNCGSCGNSCYASSFHANWSCVSRACVFAGCQAGYWDLDGDQSCEYACTYRSAAEACNGLDDDCDGQIDEQLAPHLAAPTRVCGVLPSATSPECTTEVSVACVQGRWECTFPSFVCTGSSCEATSERCDGLDNDCDGVVDEGFAGLGTQCASDDGVDLKHGVCRTSGTVVCDGPSAVVCSATKADCNTLPAGCTERCDGVDNDCDGLVDEAFNNKGSNVANFVKPAVTKLSTNLWIYTYEASRPSATEDVPGLGNGYWTAAPAGLTLDKTPACSVPNKIPWFNVTPLEAEQTCTQMGGALCTMAQYQTACRPNAPSSACLWGYNPRGAAGSACATDYVAGTKFCNLGPSYDFGPMTAGDQDGLLPTASSALANCWADWSSLQGNTASTNKIFDLTGNLREITKNGASYAVMGGAFVSQVSNGASCSFTSYSASATFQLYDAGFRCCFTSDPTL
ncbi:MAG: hypothetical protein HY901_32505 [Deltaproteobacteria bacterium]|nr:hypothetical protein [Deltaproteobacteria bacterium]